MKIGWAIGSWEDIYTMARYAEIIEGYDSFENFTVGETHSNRNPFMTLAIIATRTKRLKLGATVMAGLMHPVMLARNIITLDELAPTRAEIHIGLGGSDHFPKLGLEQPAPLATLREAIYIIKQLIAGEEVTYQGKVFNIANQKIPWGPARKIPVWAAVNGIQMSKVAGAIADGLYLAMRSVDYVALPVKEFKQAAKEAGRTGELLPIGQHIVTYTARNSEAAWQKVTQDRHRLMQRLYRFATEEPFVLEVTGYTSDEIEIVRQHPDNVPNPILHRFANAFYLVGSPEDLIHRLKEYERVGFNFTYITFSRRSTTRIEDIQLIGDYVAPAFQ